MVIFLSSGICCHGFLYSCFLYIFNCCIYMDNVIGVTYLWPSCCQNVHTYSSHEYGNWIIQLLDRPLSILNNESLISRPSSLWFSCINLSHSEFCRKSSSLLDTYPNHHTMGSYNLPLYLPTDFIISGIIGFISLSDHGITIIPCCRTYNCGITAEFHARPISWRTVHEWSLYSFHELYCLLLKQCIN